MNNIFRSGRILLAAVGMLALQSTVLAASAQLEIAEPVFTGRPGLVHAQAFIGLVSGSDVYDTAGSLGATFQVGKNESGRFYFFWEYLHVGRES